MRRHDIRSDAGFSLVEIVITIAIVGVTFSAILGGLFASITVSALKSVMSAWAPFLSTPRSFNPKFPAVRPVIL